MAESNATQVILTDDGIKIIKAQNTADNAAGGVTDLNDPNLMSVVEKQYNIGHFSGLTSQYNVIVQDAKNDGIDTTALTAAYNNLNNFMANVLADPNHASDIDRATYKKYQDAYNEELAKIQSAFQNDANNRFASAAAATSQAASTASQAFSAADSAYSRAQTIGNQVDSEMTVQSTATAKAQSAADSASSQAIKAIDTGNVASQAVTDLKDGSTMTIAQLQNGLEDKISNSEYASYKWQTASQIGELVTDGAFSAYQQTTKDLISAKVATSDFNSYKDQTATAIDSKVEFKDFKSFKNQTADALEDTVSNSEYASDKKQTADMIQTMVSKSPSNIIKDGGFNSATIGQVPSGWNLFTNGQIVANPDTVSNLVTTGHPVLQLNSNISSNSDTYYGDWFDVQPGDQFYTEFKARWSSASQKGAIVIGLNTCDANMGNYQWPGGANTSSPSTWTKYTGTVTVGANAAHARVWVSWQGSGASNEAVQVTDLVIRPAYSTQSDINQLSSDIDLRVKKDDLVSQINVQAKNILISTSGQLTLSADTVLFDNTKHPVIIPSANIDDLLVKKTLTTANISANKFSTNNETFIVNEDGAITAKNMTLTGGTLTTPTINGSTINGGTLNMQTDGLINSPYNGIQQTADQFYHPWKLNTGQLTIGQGYITSVSSGTRSINGVPKQFDSVQGTLSASYLKFTNNYGARTYIDADMFTYSNQSNDTAIVTIDASGIGINMGAMDAPAVTISNGCINASSSSSYGVFGAITLGYNAHTINSDDSLFFESGRGSGNPGINIWAKGFQSMSSRLSTKRQVRLLNDEHSNSLLLGADTATFQYNQDTNADNPNEGVIIDDVNTAKQYNLPDELITRDGKSPTDLMSFIARVISQNKYQARLIEDLQIRLRKVEINNG